MRVYLSVLIAFIFSFSALSQNKVRIFGYVIDTDNRGIEMANVYVENKGMGTTTNQNGYYELTLAQSDTIVLVYSLIGYETIKHTFVPAQRVTQITVQLPSKAKLMKDVEVLAQRRQTSTMDYIDPSKNRLMPGPAGGIESLLITFTGVTQNNELSSQYNVRGGNYDENIVYVNGVEVYRPLLIRAGQQEGLSFINPDLVKSVGFSAGGFDARYGDKMSSVLDISYKKPSGFESSFSASLLGATGYVGTSSDRFTQIHGLRYKTSSYLLGSLQTKGEYDPSFIDYQTYLTYKLRPKWELTFLGNISQNRYNFYPVERKTSFGTYQTARNLTIYYDGKEKDLFRTYFGTLALNYQPTTKTKLSMLASAFYTNENENYDIAGEYILSEVKTDANDTEDSKGATLGIGRYHEHARNTLKASVSSLSHAGEAKISQHLLRWGARLQFEKIVDKISEWEWRDSAGYSLPHNGAGVNLFYNLKANTSLSSVRSEVYFQDTYRFATPHARISVTAGLRAAYWSYNNELIVSPRISASLIPMWEKDYTFRFAAGVYYQSPFYKEIRDTVADRFGNVKVVLNDHIRSQRSLHFILGGDHHFRAWGRPFKFTTEAYLKLADRVISYSVDNVRVRYSGENDAKAYTAGIDFKLFGELVPGTDSWINFSLMQSKENLLNDSYLQKSFDANGNVTGSEVVYPGWISRPNEQRYAFSMMFQDYLPNNPKYKMQLKFIWSDGLPFGAPRSIAYRAKFRATPYRRVDIGASRLLASGEDKIMDKGFLKSIKNIWINLEVFNLLDFRNVNSYYWVTDIYGQQLATPNYLTGRQLNLRLIVDLK